MLLLGLRFACWCKGAQQWVSLWLHGMEDKALGAAFMCLLYASHCVTYVDGCVCVCICTHLIYLYVWSICMC